MATTPVWPSSLPAPQVSSGYGYQQISPFIRTTMDSGKFRYRRRFISVPWSGTLSFRMTKAQLAIFESFFANDLAGGSVYFMVPIINGQGKNNVLAHFSDMPKTNGVDGSTTVFDVSISTDIPAMPVGAV